MVIVALGRAAPVESITVPLTVPTGACADRSRITPQNRHTKSTAARLYILMPLLFLAESITFRVPESRLRQCLTFGRYAEHWTLVVLTRRSGRTDRPFSRMTDAATMRTTQAWAASIEPIFAIVGRWKIPFAS